MIFILISVVIYLCVFAGIGALFNRFTFLKVRNNPFLLVFLGISVSGLYFDAVQLLVPLTICTLIPVIILGVIGLFIYMKDSSRLIVGFPKWYIFALVMMVYCYICSQASIVGASDTMDYHSTIVSWMNAYKIVPGLANLHGRYGMNSMTIHLAAGVDVGIWDKQSSYLIPALMELSYIGFCLFENFNEEYSKNRKIYMLIILVWLPLSVLMNPDLLAPTLYYDTPAHIYFALLVTELLFGDNEKQYGFGTSYESIFFLAAISFAIKPTSAISVVVVFITICYRLWKEKNFSLTRIIKISIFPIIVLVLFLLRNIIQTGFPLFPIVALKVNAKWALPEYKAYDTYTAIIRCAERPKDIIGCIKSFIFTYECWYVFVFAIAIILAIKSLRIKKTRALFYYTFILINILYWFLMAPSFRFGSVFFFAFLAVALYFNDNICNRIYELKSNKLIMISFGALLVISGITLKTPFVRGALFDLSSSLIGRNIQGYSLEKMIEFSGGWLLTLGTLILVMEIKKEMLMRSYLLFVLVFCIITSKNLLITVPIKSYPVKIKYINGDEPIGVYVPAGDYILGDAPLPCTMTYDENVYLFDASDMGKGFYSK